MLVHEIIPAENRESTRLMIALHGLGDSIEGYRWLPEAIGRTDINYALVNAPDDYYGGYSWYDIPGDSKPGVLRSRELLLELLAELASKGYPPDQTLLFGFSQGCLMTIDVGFRYPHKLAGLIGVSGYAFEPENLATELTDTSKEQQMLFTHGLRDPLIPLAPVRDQQLKILREAGLQIQWQEFDKEHTIAGEEELRVIRAFIEKCYGT